MEITWIVIWLKITIRHNQVQQQKMINKSKRGPEESEPQYHSQVKSERSQNLFDLDLDCIEDNL